jgi:hypothetical protein
MCSFWIWAVSSKLLFFLLRPSLWLPIDYVAPWASTVGLRSCCFFSFVLVLITDRFCCPWASTVGLHFLVACSRPEVSIPACVTAVWSGDFLGNSLSRSAPSRSERAGHFPRFHCLAFSFCGHERCSARFIFSSARTDRLAFVFCSWCLRPGSVLWAKSFHRVQWAKVFPLPVNSLSRSVWILSPEPSPAAVSQRFSLVVPAAQGFFPSDSSFSQGSARERPPSPNGVVWISLLVMPKVAASAPCSFSSDSPVKVL